MRQKGFTFIELLTVVGIMGILIFLVSGYYANGLKVARERQRVNDLSQYRTALENYATQNDSLYPIFVVTVSAFSQLCPQLGTVFMAKCIEDPMTLKDANFSYKYQSSATGGRWVLWAKLEKENKNWVVCSSNKTGEISTTGFVITDGVCPL